MTIPVACPDCKFSFHVKDTKAGTTGKCPQCKAPILVPGGEPAEPELMQVKIVAVDVSMGDFFVLFLRAIPAFLLASFVVGTMLGFGYGLVYAFFQVLTRLY